MSGSCNALAVTVTLRKRDALCNVPVAKWPDAATPASQLGNAAAPLMPVTGERAQLG